MESKPKVYLYHTAVKWTEQRKGVISCAGKPEVQVATPPEFKGHDGIWSPEDLFVASANICLMTTFLAVAERAGLAFTERTERGRFRPGFVLVALGRAAHPSAFEPWWNPRSWTTGPLTMTSTPAPPVVTATPLRLNRRSNSASESARSNR